ncbi:MAG: AsmA family protein, partial [Chromatiales bacterium]|nr:AsmA family protein [Chromatiales bacterium]
MGKIVKGLLYLLSLLVGLTIILMIAIPLFVDPNDYRDQMSSVVKEKTGRTLDIKGEIKLSLFPWIGVELGEMSLSNAKGFGDSAFARVKKVDIKIKLLPLLRKAVEMDTVVLHGMSLNLAKKSNGTD